jgi:hypothetical protein
VGLLSQDIVGSHYKAEQLVSLLLNELCFLVRYEICRCQMIEVHALIIAFFGERQFIVDLSTHSCFPDSDQDRARVIVDLARAGAFDP